MLSIEEHQFQVFINSVEHYFKQICGKAPEFRPPYILDDSLKLQGYTGVINVTGKYQGSVYFTSEAGLLHALLESLGDPRRDEEALADCVGEVANTISGNFRRDYGSQFIISTPRIQRSEGKEYHPANDTTTYIVPVSWMNNEALLIVVLKEARVAA